MRGFTSGKGLIFKQLINCLNVIFLFHSFIGPTVKGGPKGGGEVKERRERRWGREKAESEGGWGGEAGKEATLKEGDTEERRRLVGRGKGGWKEGKVRRGKFSEKKRRYRKAGEKDGHVCGRGGVVWCSKELLFKGVCVHTSFC